MVSQVRQVLREATAAAHQRLHRHPVLAPLTAPTLSLASYRRALVAFHAIHAGADLRLAGYWPDRPPRAPLVADDLRALGVEPPGPPFLVLPGCSSPAAFLGCRYVIEGSYFGGRALAGNVQAVLGLGADSGAGFFSGGSLDGAGEWRRLLDLLETLDRPAECGLATEAAQATFSGIESWLDLASGAASP